MLIVQSRNAVPIRLTPERWEHIVRRHPAMELERNKVLETVRDPDIIQEGDSGELIALRFYRRTTMTTKFVSVVYLEFSHDDGFVITAYHAPRPSKERPILWKK